MKQHKIDEREPILEEMRKDSRLVTHHEPSTTPQEREMPLFGFDVFSLPLDLSPESPKS